jgi:hypothetical protein
LEEAHLTYIYQVVFHLCQLESIDYLVLRYLNAGVLPFEEWAEEWLFDVEVKFSYTVETASGEGSIFDTLGTVSQEVESWDKTREKE